MNHLKSNDKPVLHKCDLKLQAKSVIQNSTLNISPSLPLVFFLLNQDLSLVLHPPLTMPPALYLTRFEGADVYNVNHFNNKLANIVVT